MSGSDRYEIGKVVVATDFSEAAARAADWGAAIARAHGAHLTLVHAAWLPAPAPDYVAPEADFGGGIQQAARARLEEEAARLGESGAEIHPRLAVGSAVEAILDLCREIGADLLVAGARGHSQLHNLLLGSTAERLVQQADCPVLTASDAAAPPPGRLAGILVPTDFGEDARRAAAVAAVLLRGGEQRARLVLFHAYSLPIDYGAYGLAPVSPAFLEESRIRAEADLEEQAALLRREGLAVEMVAAAGYPVESILAVAEEHRVDLIAMGTSGRTGAAHLLLGSTAERVVQRAGCPVLTLRDWRRGGDSNPRSGV